MIVMYYKEIQQYGMKTTRLNLPEDGWMVQNDYEAAQHDD